MLWFPHDMHDQVGKPQTVLKAIWIVHFFFFFGWQSYSRTLQYYKGEDHDSWLMINTAIFDEKICYSFSIHFHIKFTKPSCFDRVSPSFQAHNDVIMVVVLSMFLRKSLTQLSLYYRSFLLLLIFLKFATLLSFF